MAKKHSQPNHWLTVASAAIIIAVLLGVAYLANNTTSSQAATFNRLSAITTPRNSTSAPQSASESNSLTIPGIDNVGTVSPYSECQPLLDSVNTTLNSLQWYQAMMNAQRLLEARARILQAQILSLKQQDPTSPQIKALEKQLSDIIRQINWNRWVISVRLMNVLNFAEYMECIRLYELYYNHGQPLPPNYDPTPKSGSLGAPARPKAFL